MSTFFVPVIKVEELVSIKGADLIELAKVKEYYSVVKKGQFQVGDLAVYIPEQSIVPEDLLKQIGLEGKLAGSKRNRVKIVKLRGVYSQGILIPNRGWEEGFNAAEDLGITKWEPEEERASGGPNKTSSYSYPGLVNIGSDFTVKYDLENYKWYNDILVEDELVVMTEKVHGTNVQVGILPVSQYQSSNYGGIFHVSSKGLGAKGFSMKDEAPTLYSNVAKQYKLFGKLLHLQMLLQTEEPVYIIGEIYGNGIQDLNYGSDTESKFLAFDICYGRRGAQTYLDYPEFLKMTEILEIPTVPVLYFGRFSKEALLEHTNGLETLSGRGLHIREGVVVRPIKERSERGVGRVILKSVSEAYLMRANATEFN